MYDELWWSLYKTAVLEVDSSKLGPSIRAAEEAIRARASLDGKVSSKEKTALLDAQSALRVLKIDWEKHTPPAHPAKAPVFDV